MEPLDILSGRVCPYAHIYLFSIDYRAQFKMSNEENVFGGLGEVISKHGWIPFLGLGAAALISKEIFHVNTEVVVLVNFSIVAFTGYVLGADEVIQSYKEFREEEVEYIQKTFQAKKDILKANIECCEAIVNKPLVIKDIHAAFIEANAAVAKARALAAHQAARDNVTSQLNALYLKEQAEINARREAIRTKAREYVLQHVTGDAVKSSVLKEALTLVGATEDKTGQFTAVTKLIEDAVKAAKK